MGRDAVKVIPPASARAFGQAAWAQAIGFVLIPLPVGPYFALSEASASSQPSDGAGVPPAGGAFRAAPSDAVPVRAR